MVEKAAWLIENGRVVKISDYMFYIIGRRSRHVVRKVGGKLVCTCEGYRAVGMCSHSLAVSTILNMKNQELVEELVQRRVERELRKLFR